MISASAHICSLTLACRSSVIAIGVSAPQTARNRDRISASPSAQKSVTMAPCSPSRIASWFPVSSAATSGSHNQSKAAVVTRPERRQEDLAQVALAGARFDWMLRQLRDAPEGE